MPIIIRMHIIYRLAHRTAAVDYGPVSRESTKLRQGATGHVPAASDHLRKASVDACSRHKALRTEKAPNFGRGLRAMCLLQATTSAKLRWTLAADTRPCARPVRRGLRTELRLDTISGHDVPARFVRFLLATPRRSLASVLARTIGGSRFLASGGRVGCAATLQLLPPFPRKRARAWALRLRVFGYM